MTLRAFSGLIDNNDQVRISCLGAHIYMRAASSQILVSADSIRNDQGGKILASRIPMTSRQAFNVQAGESFDNITLRNESGAQVSYDLVAGFGLYQAPLSSVSIEVPSILTAGADVTANAAGAQLLPANANRKIAWVSVDPAAANEAVLAGSQANAAAGIGMILSPGISYPVETVAEIWVARISGGSDVTVHVLETEYA